MREREGELVYVCVCVCCQRERDRVEESLTKFRVTHPIIIINKGEINYVWRRLNKGETNFENMFFHI